MTKRNDENTTDRIPIKTDNEFILKNTTQRRLHSKKELRDRLNPKVQCDRTFNLIERAKEVATCE